MLVHVNKINYVINMNYTITAVSPTSRVEITFPRPPSRIVLPEGWNSAGYIMRLVDDFDPNTLPLALDDVQNNVINETLNRSTF